LFEPPEHHNLFMKNVAILGGLLIILTLFDVGPGR
jgi:hypothetical protein